MVPIHIAFSGYAIIGLTLLILAASAALFLLRLSHKSRATWSLIGFFGMVALSGAATILANSFLFWDRLLIPWQDFWILAGGVALAQFAYTFPQHERSVEARIVLVLMSSLALLALVYCITFDYRFLFQWTPRLDVSDAYYLLLPLGILLIVIVFLRRSVHFTVHSESAVKHVGSHDSERRLIHPQGETAKAFRNLALALSLAFLPGLQTLVSFPDPYAFILSNIGSILAIVAIALVYFNYAPEVDSFMAKLVGITLATVLLIFAVFGAVDAYIADRDFNTVRLQIVAAVQDGLIRTGDLIADLTQVAYVVSWDASDPQDVDAYRQLYVSDDEVDFDLVRLLDDNGQGNIDSWSQAISGLFTRNTNDAWWLVRRYVNRPPGDYQEDYQGYVFVAGDVAHEIGFSRVAISDYLSAIVEKWLLLILVCSATVLLVFPLFFRRNLVEPLGNLLQGIRRVNQGELDTAVPVRFHDEIGFLTHSFNSLVQTVRESEARQGELFAELQASYAELEERITERTRELAAFTDLTMLSGDQESVSDVLRPALTRIMALGLCEALAIHLLSADRDALELVDQRLLPESNTKAMAHVKLPAAFALRVNTPDDPLLLTPERDPYPLPEALQISSYETYLGCSLMAGEQSHGWLSCYRSYGSDFTMGEISLMVALARQIGVIIENHELRQRLKQTAATLERRRLGRDLHDSVTQLLYGMTLFTGSAKEAMEDGDRLRLERSLNNLANAALQALREMRFMLFELQPPVLAEEGLVQALQARLDMVERRVGVQIDFAIDEGLPHEERVDQELYYVAIEALNNAFKHGNARWVGLSIYQEDGCVSLVVADNGQGFDTDLVTPGLGLRSMRQRMENLGGELTIRTALNEGTEIIAKVPL